MYDFIPSIIVECSMNDELLIIITTLVSFSTGYFVIYIDLRYLKNLDFSKATRMRYCIVSGLLSALLYESILLAMSIITF